MNLLQTYLQKRTGWRTFAIRFLCILMPLLLPLITAAETVETYADWKAYAEGASTGDGGTDVANSDNTNYTIKTARGLAWVANQVNTGTSFVNCTLTLANDINLADVPVTNNNWISIGISSDKPFQGTFNGAGHTISGMTITAATIDVEAAKGYAGLFGIAYGGTIKNLHVEGSISLKESTNDTFIGGIVATTNSYTITITNCSSNVDIVVESSTTADLCVGGIIGQAAGTITAASTITNVYSTGDIKVTDTNSKSCYAGGIAGNNSNYATITNCYSTGDITVDLASSSAKCYAGGLVGNNSGTLKCGYATGSIKGKSGYGNCYVGGICGQKAPSSNPITECLALNTPALSSKAITNESDENVGKIAGKSGSSIFGSNYASTNATTSTAIKFDGSYQKRHGIDIYLENYQSVLDEIWTQDSNPWKFEDGKLPTLQGVPGTQTQLSAADYLAESKGLPLKLSSNDSYGYDYDKGKALSIKYENNYWRYQYADRKGDYIPFNGTIEKNGIETNYPYYNSSSPITITAATGNPTLTFDDVWIERDGTVLTINESCELTLNSKGDCRLICDNTTDGYGIENKGTLTLQAGDGSTLLIASKATEAAALKNSGKINVTGLQNILVSHIDKPIENDQNSTISNWTEWALASSASSTSGMIWRGTTYTDMKKIGYLYGDYNAFATWLPQEGEYKLGIGDASIDATKLLRGVDNSEIPQINYKSSPDATVKYTKVEKIKAVTIDGETSYVAATHRCQNITIATGGKLTIDDADAAVNTLTVEGEGQLVANKKLEVEDVFTVKRNYKNKQWYTFASLFEMKVVKLAYSYSTTTGYLDSKTDGQQWETNHVQNTPMDANKSYLFKWENEFTVSDLNISFYATGITIPAVSESPLTIPTDIPLGEFRFVANPTLQSQTVENAYILNVATNRFELASNTTVPPMSAFIMAGATGETLTNQTEGQDNYPALPRIISYTPTMDEGTVDVSFAKEADKTTIGTSHLASYRGAKVTITATPNSAMHKSKAPVVTKTGGTETTTVTPVENEPNKFTFVMPDYAVTISEPFQSSANFPLEIPADNTDNITLTYKDDNWHYKFGNDDEIPFNGTIKNASGTTSSNTITVSEVTGGATLTLDGLKLAPTNTSVPALTVNTGITLTLKVDGATELSSPSTSAATLDNKGTLTITAADADATLTVASANAAAISGLTTGNLMEWQFAQAISGAAKDANWYVAGSDPETAVGSSSLPVGTQSFATLIAPGSYSLKIGETIQKGYPSTSGGKATYTFVKSEGNAPAVYKNTSDLKEITISSAMSFADNTHKDQRIIVDANGTLTIGTANASVMSLTIQPGGQVTLTNPLEVLEGFSVIRKQKNVWNTFSTPIAMTATVASGHLLYAASGYAAITPGEQGWKGEADQKGVASFAFAAQKPYLIAAEKTDEAGGETEITFKTLSSGCRLTEDPVSTTAGEALPNGIFLFHRNGTLRNQTLSGIYVLDPTKNRFDLKTTEYALKPFECFITANAVTRSQVSSLVIGSNLPTATDQVVLNEGVRVWGKQGMLHIGVDRPSDVTILNVSGQVMRQLQGITGDTQVTLPSGIYFVRCNSITYKIVL